MPFSHFKLIESFDWTTTITDIERRYQVPSTTGSITVQTGQGRFGGNCMQVVGEAQFFLQPVGTDLGPWGPDFTFGIAWNGFDNAVSQNYVSIWHGVRGSGGHAQTVIRVSPTGHLQLMAPDFTTVLATGPTAMLDNTYYYIEVSIHIDPAAGSCDAFIGGVAEFSIAGVNTQGGPDNLFDSFVAETTGFDAFQLDDMYLKDTLGHLGERRVILVSPASDSAPLQWTPSTGVTHFNLVNEVPPDGDTSYVSSSTPGQIDTYGMSALPYSPVTIDTVQTSLYVRKDDAGAREVSIVVNGTTSAVVIVVTSTYNDYIEMWDQNPLTSAPWAGASVPATAGVNEIA